MAKEITQLLPMKAIMGWNDGVETKKDAVEIARGYAQKRFNAVDSSWYAVAPFMGGYLWETHEGGQGKGYIQSAIEGLSNNPAGIYWFPCGDRVFQIMLRDGKPFGILLSKKDSDDVLKSGISPLIPTTKMSRTVRQGTTTLAFGSAMMASSSLFFISTMIFYAVAGNPGPSVANFELATMPHQQWQKVSGIKVEELVSKLEFKDSSWSVEKRPHDVPGLADLKNKTLENLNKVKEAIAVTPEIPANLETPSAVEPPQVAPNAPAQASPPTSSSVDNEKERLRKQRAEALRQAIQAKQAADNQKGKAK